MILSKKQEEGLRISVERYNQGELYTCIAGYAGSGKTTLINFIVSALGIPQERVAYVAFTGKAATVLRQKGCPNATTAHKLLYEAKPQPDGTFIFIEKKEIDYDLIIVDEVSMLPLPMWELLMRYKKYVLACGDPF